MASHEIRAKFAARLGVNRSTVTRWAEQGRLIEADGRVDVEASLARLQATSGGRDDVKLRHALARAAKNGASAANGAGDGAIPHPDPAIGTQPAADAPRSESRADAQARKEAAQADLAEMEVKQKRGELILREDVDAALKAMGAAVRAAMDVFPDQTAPLVAPVTVLDECHLVLQEQCRNVLAGIADQLARQAESIAQSQKLTEPIGLTYRGGVNA